MRLMLNSLIFHQHVTKHLYLLSYQSTLSSWELTTVYQYTYHRSSHTRYYRTCVQVHTSAGTILLSSLLKVNDSLKPILSASTIEITTDSYPVELQTSNTILKPPPILYIHIPQVNNIKPHVILLELETKFSILHYLLLRIK